MSLEIKGINPELNHMVAAGQFSGRKLADLIRLKQLVDRFAGRPYVTPEEMLSLKVKYGEEPDIVTWGDFFQTEVGSRYFMLTDDEFARIADTVHFDLISAAMVFEGKQDNFIEMVSEEGLAAYGIPREDWTEDQAEQAHLYILLQYYQEMSLSQKTITDEDRKWFGSFVSVARYAVG